MGNVGVDGQIISRGGFSLKFNEQAPFRVMHAISFQQSGLVVFEPQGQGIGVYSVRRGHIERSGTQFRFYYEGADRALVLDDRMLVWIRDGKGRELWPNPAPAVGESFTEEEIRPIHPAESRSLRLPTGVQFFRTPDRLVVTGVGKLTGAGRLKTSLRKANADICGKLPAGAKCYFDPPIGAPLEKDLERGIGRLVMVESCRYLRFDERSERHIISMRRNGEEVILAAFIPRAPKFVRG